MPEKLEFKKELLKQLREVSGQLKDDPQNKYLLQRREGLQKLFDICNARNRF